MKRALIAAIAFLVTATLLAGGIYAGTGFILFCSERTTERHVEEMHK